MTSRVCKDLELASPFASTANPPLASHSSELGALLLDFCWAKAGLVDLLTRLLMPGFSEDDIVLECVMLAAPRETKTHCTFVLSCAISFAP